MAPKGNKINHPNRKGVKITPYKGGRSAQLHIAVKPEIKAALQKLSMENNETPGDTLERLILEAVDPPWTPVADE